MNNPDKKVQGYLTRAMEIAKVLPDYDKIKDEAMKALIICQIAVLVRAEEVKQ